MKTEQLIRRLLLLNNRRQLLTSRSNVASGDGGGITLPSSISGLTGWWKADTLGLSDGAAVAAWSDSGSGGIDLSQSNASLRPVYRATGGPNNTPAVQFTGVTPTSVQRANVLGSALFGANQFHAFIVQKETQAGGQNMTFYWNSGTNVIDVYAAFGGTIYFDYGNTSDGNGRRSVAQPTGWSNNWHLLQLIREAPNSGTSRIRVDGAQLTSGSVTATITTNITATFMLGTGASSITGYIAEVFFFNVALSASDRQLMEAYINSKYSIF